MIKIGEYIRDNEGNIDKIINTLSLFKDVYLYLGEEGYQYSENAISKHSKNIIDLIEEGDYVNGSKVIDIAQGKTKAAYIESKEQKFALIPIVEKQIKSIVTKEQFANMEYKVKE